MLNFFYCLGDIMSYRTFVIISFTTILLLCLFAIGTYAGQGNKPLDESSDSSPLYLLTYDHGGLVLWGSDHFVRYLRSAVEWLDRYPSFKIGLDNEAYTYDQLARANPEVLHEIRTYIKKYAGRFGIGTCTYGQPLSVFINEESNIRQIGYALAADRRNLGYTPSVYLMSEHAMHSQIPQILKGFGFKGAIMRTHFMMYGYNPTFDAAVGWWVGLDGSRIPAIPTYKGEGAQFGQTTVDNWILTRYPGSNAPKSPADFRKEFARISPLLATRADDAGLRREELVKEYEGKPGYKWILLEEIFPTFPAPREEFKTKPNDFVVRMPWGYCGNEIWNLSRRAEVAVLTAERAAAIAMLTGGTNHQAELENAWKNLLVGQHHDIQICGLLDDARRFLPESINISQNVLKSSLQQIASQMSAGDNPQIVVFNPVSWQRKEWFEISVSLPRGFAKNLQIVHGDKIIPSAILAAGLHSDGSLKDIKLALYADLTGLSVCSYKLVPIENKLSNEDKKLTVDSQNLTITTPFIEVHFDPKGGISSMKDRRTSKELLVPEKRSTFFAGRIDGKDIESGGLWSLESAKGGAPWALARQSGMIGTIPYTFEMKFYAGRPRIDCQARFSFAGQKIGQLSDNKRDSVSGFVHEHKLRFKVFPALGDSAIGVRDLPFAVSRTPDRYVNGLYWTAVTDGEKGLGVFNRGTMGAVREQDGGFSIPLAFAMYYVWGTRMLTGDYVYEIALYPFTGTWEQADLHKRAIEYNYPLVGIFAPAGNGKFGHTIQPLTISPSDVIVSALYNLDDELYIRMYEHRGKDCRVSLGYTMSQVRMTEVDLAGQELSATSDTLNFTPWQIKTVRITPAGR
jgi:alpha-mannosidase